MKIYFLLSLTLLTTTVSFASEKVCNLNVYTDYNTLIYQVFIGGQEYNGDSPYRNLIPALKKLKEIEEDEGCRVAYNKTNAVCFIVDNTSLLKGDIDHPRIGSFDIEMQVASENHTSGFYQKILANGNSREEAISIGEEVKKLGICKFVKY